jgi:hypothetical protein
MTNSPNILLDNVDLGQAIPTVLSFAFLNSGQGRGSQNREASTNEYACRF